MKKSTPANGKAAAAGDPETAARDAECAARKDLRDPQLVQRLRDYQQRHQLTDSTKDQETLARRMGSSSTYVYRYLAGTFLGDLGKFEARVRDFLDGEVLTVDGNQELVAEDFVIPSMFAFLRQVQSHGYIGVGHGPAGRGKTCAARLYAAKHRATCVYLHAYQWTGGRHGLTADLAATARIKTAKGEPIDQALIRTFAGSGRLVIIDNAQRLSEGARRWLADFYDATRTPIALIGNPEIERQWQRNDQHGSRVGLHRDVTVDLVDKTAGRNTAERTAAHLLRLHLPEAATVPQVRQEAAAILARPGSGACRAVVMRARLARTMLDGGRITDPAKAFHLAETQLINAA